MVDDFNSRDSSTFVFLISTKAGGMGLNLPAANKCVNPPLSHAGIDSGFMIQPFASALLQKAGAWERQSQICSFINDVMDNKGHRTYTAREMPSKRSGV